MSLISLKTLPEYKQVCEHINPVYTDIIFSYLTKIIKEYYKSGEISGETPILNIGSEDGKIHGIQKRYYKYGQIYYEVPYINNKIHGILKFYRKCGKITEEISFINDQKHGIRKVYYNSGLIKSEKLYEHGKLI
jgi:antitoxin component YwqK of YwqJK toxin-antitoxin module